MPHAPEKLDPAAIARKDMRSKYIAEYQKKARGGKFLSWGEMGKLALLAVAVGGMMATSFMSVPSVVFFGFCAATMATTLTAGTPSRAERRADAAFTKDLEDGKLFDRYSKDLAASAEIADVKAKFEGLRQLTDSFGAAVSPAAEVTAAALAAKPAAPAFKA